MKHIYTLFLFIAFTVSSFAQLSLSVTTTDEYCNGTGRLEFSVSGQDPSPAVVYEVFDSNTDESITQGAINDDFLEVSAGTYDVVATQGANSDRVDDLVIQDLQEPVDFNFVVDNTSCGNSVGTITINTTSGIAPFTYQILDSNSNVITSQTNNVFSDLAEGDYRIRVLDDCGTGEVRSITVLNVSPTPINVILSDRQLNMDCNTRLKVRLTYDPDSNVSMSDLDYTLTYINPETQTQVTETGNLQTTIYPQNNYSGTAYIDVPDYEGEEIEYTIALTDECGSVITQTDTFTHKYKDRLIPQDGYVNLAGSEDCGDSFGFRIEAFGVGTPAMGRIQSINLTTVPAGVDINTVILSPSTFINNTVNYSQVGTSANPLAEGIYEGTLIGCNGQEIPFSHDYNISNDLVTPTFTIQTLNAGNYCDGTTNKFTIRPSTDITIENYTVLNPPNGGEFGVVNYNNPNSNDFGFITYNYPSGTYTLELDLACDLSTTIEFTVVEPSAFVEGEIEPVFLCGSFNLVAQASPQNIAGYYRRVLQIYDESLNGWTTPRTDTDRVVSTEEDLTNYNFYVNQRKFYNLNSINKDAPALSSEQNIEFIGRFRVIEQYYSDKYDISGTRETILCSNVIKEFEYDSAPLITDVYGFQCVAGNSIGVNIEDGDGPFTYQIVANPNLTTDDNIITDNGNDPLFTGLGSGSYNIRVLDNCGNITTQTYAFTNLTTPTITATIDCDTEEYILFVKGAPYLNYNWYRTDDPTNSLSTTNILNLGNLEANGIGSYTVAMTSSTQTCILVESQEVITENPFTAPFAGNDFEVTYDCPGLVNSIDLLDLINQNNTQAVPQDGTFEFINPVNPDPAVAGTISANVWELVQTLDGTYVIEYTVAAAEGSCADGTSLININFEPTPNDTTAPTVSGCPDNISVEASDPNGVAVTYIEPIFEDCNGVTVTSTHQPGDIFPIGATTVTYTGTDPSDNITTCEFIVTVVNAGCSKAPSTAPVMGEVIVGVSTLGRDKDTNSFKKYYEDNLNTNAWLVIEAKSSGMAITRVDDQNHPENIVDPVPGMIVYDIDADCIKLYDGTAWGCIVRGCDD